MLVHPRVRELHVVDAVADDSCVLTDAVRLTSVARAAVAAGAGHVLKEALVRFPNGAITLVLVLAESHLSIHTWPEERRIAIDLFSCGAIDGGRVLEVLRDELSLRDVSLRRIGRGG